MSRYVEVLIEYQVNLEFEVPDNWDQLTKTEKAEWMEDQIEKHTIDWGTDPEWESTCLVDVDGTEIKFTSGR